MAWWIPLAMAAASAAQEKQKVDKANAVQAPINQAKAKWSGWTGMEPGQVQIADMLGAGMQGAGAGMAMSQNMDRSDGYNNWLNRQTTDSSGNSSAWGQTSPNSGQYRTP